MTSSNFSESHLLVLSTCFLFPGITDLKWMSAFNWRESFLSFKRIKIVWLSYIGMSTMEGLVVMVLLVDTQLECGFVPFFQTAIVPTQVVLSFFAQFASGIFTDQTAPYAHRILQITCGICLVVDPLMFLFGRYSQWIMLGLFAVRYATLVQLNNSTGKVLKLHLVRTKVSEEEQLPKVANVSVFSDCMGRMVAVIFGYSIPLLLVDYVEVDFNTLKYCCFSTIFALDCAAFTTSLFIPSSYINPPKLAPGAAGVTEVDKSALLDEKTDMLDKPEEEKGCWRATVNYFSQFFKAHLLWMATLQIGLGILCLSFLSIILRFELAEPPSSKVPPTRENLCDLRLRNLLLQDLVGDGIRAASAIFYEIVLTNMRPWWFFSRVWFMMMTFVALLVGSTYWEKMPTELSSVVLGLLLATIFMVLVFTNSTITAVVPESIYGFTFAMQGALNTLVLLIPSGIAALEPARWVSTTILLSLLGVLGAWTIFMVKWNKKTILKLDKNIRAKSRVESCVWGYPIEYAEGFDPRQTLDRQTMDRQTYDKEMYDDQ